MALGSSLRERRVGLRAAASGLGAWLVLFGALALCRCEPRKPAGDPSRAGLEKPAKAPRAAQQPHRSTAEVAASFLVRTDEGKVELRSLDGGGSVVLTRATSWLYDDAHQLIWAVHEGKLSALDVRVRSGATPIAEGLPLAPRIWVQWPASDPSRFVQSSSACEPGDIVQLDVGEPPSLRLLGEERRIPLAEGGRRWLRAQVTRPTRAPRERGFDASSDRIALPASVAACDDPERCGSSAAYGPHGHRLVLVRDRLGSDCWHRGCLLYDPATDRFASPPVVEDEATGELSAAGGPSLWSSAEAVRVGVCGPYRFDATETRVLVRRHLCRWDATCLDLAGEALGWLEPGPVVGEPG